MARKVLPMLRTLVMGSSSAQHAVASAPGMCAALVSMLSDTDDQVAGEAAVAAETLLAALQRDSGETRVCVSEAGKVGRHCAAAGLSVTLHRGTSAQWCCAVCTV